MGQHRRMISPSLETAVKVLSRIKRQRLDCISIQSNRNSIFSTIGEPELRCVRKSIGIFEDEITDTFYELVRVHGAKFDRQLGAYLGMVLGDYLGAPIEFLDVVNVSLSIRILDDGTVLYPEETRNVFRLKLGQWTDDASMGACMADSLLVHDRGNLDSDRVQGASPEDGWCKSFSGSDMRSRFWNWSQNGYNNAFLYSTDRSPYRSVGLGGNIGKSLAPLSGLLAEQIPDFYETASEDSGNGGIMRLAPVPIFYSHLPVRVCLKYCGLSSQTTHPGSLATRAAEFLGLFIYRAINRSQECRKTAVEFSDDVANEFIDILSTSRPPGFELMLRLLRSGEPDDSTELSWNWKNGSMLFVEQCMINRGDYYNGYPNSLSYYGSYCLDGLALALHSFRHSNSFESCIMKCVNYRGDADSTGSVCGQMAGAFYGVSTIHRQLLNNAMQWDKSENIFRAIMLTTVFRDEFRGAVSSGTDCEFSFDITYQHEPAPSEHPVFTSSYPQYPPIEHCNDERSNAKTPNKKKSVLSMLSSIFSWKK